MAVASGVADVLIAAVFIAYNTLMRQGNLLLTTRDTDPGHTLRAMNVWAMETGLRICLNSTKIRWRMGQAVMFQILAQPGSPMYVLKSHFKAELRTLPKCV